MEQAFAEYAARAHRDLGFIHLIIGSDAQVVRVQEGADTLFLIRSHHQIGRRNQAGDDDQEFCEHLNAQTGKEYHSEPHRHEYQSASQVFFQNDADDWSCEDAGFQESPEIIELIMVFIQIVRHQQGKQNLYDFRRLDGGETECDPGTCAELGDAQARNVYQEQQEQGEHVQLFDSSAEDFVADRHNDHHQPDSDYVGTRLDDRVSVPERHRRDRRASNHQDAEHHKHSNDPKRYFISALKAREYIPHEFHPFRLYGILDIKTTRTL